MVYSHDPRDTRSSAYESYDVVTAQPSSSRISRYESDGDSSFLSAQSSPDRSSSSRRSTRISRYESDGDSSFLSAQSSPYLVPENASSADRRRVRADLRTIRNHSINENAPQHIRDMMAEVIEVSPRTEIHPGLEGVGGAAYTTRRFRDGTPAHHEVHYHGQVEDEGKRTGNLVHELTHASIGESFGRDYLHYTNPPLGEVEEPEFNETRDRMTNEEARQTQRRVPEADNKIQVKLVDLQRLTHQSRVLNTEQKQWIIERLSYGIRSPHTEFDTIINQIATQLHHWGITSADSKVARRIEHYVNRLQNERMSRNRQVTSTVRRPNYRVGMAPVTDRRTSGCNVM